MTPDKWRFMFFFFAEATLPMKCDLHTTYYFLLLSQNYQVNCHTDRALLKILQFSFYLCSFENWILNSSMMMTNPLVEHLNFKIQIFHIP